jgi:hypothetical protein
MSRISFFCLRRSRFCCGRLLPWWWWWSIILSFECVRVCELYLALKYSVYTDLRGRSLIVKEKERRTMRKIRVTARWWDLIFDVLWDDRRWTKTSNKKRKRALEKRRKKRKTKKFLSPHYWNTQKLYDDIK